MGFLEKYKHKERFSYGEYPKNWSKELKQAQVVIGLCGRTGIGIRAGRVLRYLQNEKERLFSEFAMRRAR